MGLLKNELKLTMAYLQIHPKVYWIWNHRKWCLEHVPLGPAAAQVSDKEVDLEEENEGIEKRKTDQGMTEGWRIGFWKGELAVIEALLDADPRNCMSSPRHLFSSSDVTLTQQSMHGIIVDTYSHPFPLHLPHPERLLRN